MSNTPQKRTQDGITPIIQAAGSGFERRTVDPNLKDERGRRIAPHTIALSNGFALASINNDPNLPNFGTFDVQNMLSVAAQCVWEASALHSIQKPVNQAEEIGFGPNGGAVVAPLSFGGGSGAYTDNLLPRYGNPIPVATIQAALDANKRTIRTLVFRPNLPTSTPPAPNTFTQWADLYAAYQAQANAGACNIQFEQDSLFGAPIAIPAGVWIFNYGDIFSGPSLGPPLGVELADGCELRNIFLFTDGLGLIGKTTGGPQLVWDQYIGTGAPTIPIFQNACTIRNEGTAPMITWAQDVTLGGEILGIGLGFSSRLEEGLFEIVELQDPGGGGLALCQFFCQATASIDKNTLRGAGNVAIQFEVNSQGGEINLEQPNYAGLGPLGNPAAFLIRANRRIRFHESQTPLDNGAVIDLEPSAMALIAPSVDGGAGITINLPRAAYFAGVINGAKKINADVNTVVTLFPQGGETIEGQASFALPVGAYNGAQFFSDGQNWFILNTKLVATSSTGPQTPLTTGAFAHYPLQEEQGAVLLTDTIGGNNCVGSTVFQIARHPIFPARTMLRFSGGAFTSLIDAGFGSVDQTIEAIVYPGNTGVGQLWFMQGGSVSNVAQWDGGVGRYTYSWQGLGALSTPSQYYFPGKDGTLAPEAAPYLLRVSRRNNGGTMEVTTYKDGYAVLPVLTTAVIPPLADRIILGNNCPVWMSDLTIWNTATPPVSALEQAQRVKPWLF